MTRKEKIKAACEYMARVAQNALVIASPKEPLYVKMMATIDNRLAQAELHAKLYQPDLSKLKEGGRVVSVSTEGKDPVIVQKEVGLAIERSSGEGVTININL